MTSDDYLVIDGVTKQYPAGGGVRDVDISVAKGEMLVLLGPSGCGKTTLLRTIAGLQDPDVGTIRLDGGDLTRTPVHKRDIAMVFQTWALFQTMTVAQNVEFGLRMRRISRRERESLASSALKLVGLEDYARRRPRELSGGQQQRVALARAIVTRPRVLLLDEPLSSLDHRIRVQLRGELKRLQRQLGLTGVYVTHDHTEALALGDRVAVMDNGAVVEVGTPVDVFHRPRRRYTAEFLGLANVLPVTGHSPSGALGTVLGEAPRVAPANGVVAVALRPDDISLHPTGETSASSDGSAGPVGTVVAVEYQPGGVLHEVQLDNGPTIRAITTAGRVLDVDTIVRVAPDWSRAVPLVD